MCLAIPGKIVQVNEDEGYLRSGKVDFGGVLRDVNLSCVPEAGIGDHVVVHVGLALSKIDEAEAQEVFRYLERMGELEELTEEVRFDS
jgi:hydrogenase expression/formation protein HypC